MTCVAELKARAVNLPVVLLVCAVISSALTLTLGNGISLMFTIGPEAASCYAPVPEPVPVSSYIVPILQNTLICILFPFTGWLADTVVGRRRAIHASLWCSWTGSLLHLISLGVQYSTCGLPANLAKYGLSVIALLFIMFGSATTLSSVPAYGLDQLEEKSSAAVRSFIHWYVWGLFVGFLISYIDFAIQSIYMIRLLIGTTFGVCIVNSFVLCLYACFYDQLQTSSFYMKKNPYKMVYKVLKYAKDHKHPVKRSAFTYWSQESPPTRVDFGKRKYGGPFKEEEVENVKTFWRIFAILLSLFGFYIPFYITYLGVFSIVNSFQGALTTVNGYGSYVVWFFGEESIVLLVPLFELLIIPLFPKVEYFFLRPLRGIVVCYVLLLVGTAMLLIITTTSYLTIPNSVSCLIISPDNLVGLSFLVFIVPILVVGVTNGPRFIFTLEFIISQSPGNMSGMLTGSFWLIQAVYINIGAIIQIPFSALTLDGPGKLPCTFWILLLNLVIGIVGLVVFFIAAKKYKARKKDDNYDYRRSIEETFERVLTSSTITDNEYNCDHEYVIVESD